MFHSYIQPVAPISDSLLEDIKKHLPSSMKKEVEKRQAELKAKEDERERQNEQKLSEMIDSDTFMRFGYVPFVVANLAWDYADTIVCMAQLLKLQETKKLSRAIRQLKADYDRLRAPYIDSAHRNSEENNMYVFEDGVKDLFNLYLVNIECDIKSAYPELQSEYIILLKAVYQCHIVLQCIYEYVRIMTIKVEKIVGHKIGDILPGELRRLDPLVIAFAGDKPISKEFEKQQSTYAKSLSNRLSRIELVETPETE